MNTQQINSILEHCSVYRGTFACDELPSLAGEGVYICNTDKRNQPGEHWIAIYLSEDGNSEFFNSYGFAPLNEYFIRFLSKNSKKVKYNKMCIQGLHSHVCGHYTIFYCLCKQKGLSLREALQYFTNNTAHNDAFIYSFICQLLNNCI
jgi:hypothetical protein